MVNDNPNGCPFTLALQVLSHRWTQYELKAWLGLNYPKDGQIFLVTYPKYSEIVFPNRVPVMSNNILTVRLAKHSLLHRAILRMLNLEADPLLL